MARRVGVAIGVVWLLASSSVNSVDLVFSSAITDLWKQNRKQEVLAIAEERLAVNSDDIVGLILKFEYQIEFVVVPDVYGTMDKILAEASKFKGSQYQKILPFLRATIETGRPLLEAMDEEQRAHERLTANIENKVPMTLPVLEALERDGLVGAADLPSWVNPSPSPSPSA